MSSFIIMVNYRTLAQQSITIYTDSIAIDNNLKKIHNLTQNLNKIWSGTQCNKYLTTWNKALETMGVYMKIVIVDMSGHIYSVARKYAIADGYQLAKRTFVYNTRLANIPLTNPSQLRFVTDKVKDFQKQVNVCFNNMLNNIDYVDKNIRKLDWSGNSYLVFSNYYSKSRTNTKSSITRLQNTLNKMITETTNAMISAESKNVSSANQLKTK